MRKIIMTPAVDRTQAAADKVGPEVITQDWYTFEEFAAELKVTASNLRQYLRNGLIKKRFAKPTRSQCQSDPTNTVRNLYSPEYVEIIKRTREGVRRGRKQGSRSATQHAVVMVNVPVFDATIAELLLKKFGGDAEIERFLRDTLTESVRPALQRIEDLKQRHEREMQDALSNL